MKQIVDKLFYSLMFVDCEIDCEIDLFADVYVSDRAQPAQIDNRRINKVKCQIDG